jgi:hypothetical protein
LQVWILIAECVVLLLTMSGKRSPSNARKGSGANTEGTASALDDSDISYDDDESLTADLHFEQEWNSFIEAVQDIVRTSPSQRPTPPEFNAKQAIDCFLGVFKHEYQHEDVFRSALFKALRTSLGNKLCRTDGTYKEIEQQEESVSVSRKKAPPQPPSEVPTNDALAPSKSKRKAEPQRSEKAGKKRRSTKKLPTKRKEMLAGRFKYWLCHRNRAR